jgi:uncharacterized cupredoxin-like copper-binding protein
MATASIACGGPTTAPSTAPTATAPSSAQPSVAPTASPVASPVAVVNTVSAVKVPPAVDSISLYEWKTIVASTMKAGKATFTISNFGTIPHELLIFKSNLDPSAYPVDAAGNIKEEGPGIKLLSDGDNIDPAGSQVRTVDLTPGKYVFVCNIPGHFKAGMFTVVTVGS